MRLFESERSGKLFQKVLELAGIFYNAGGRALLVGGAVRDSLSGRRVKDFDLEIHDLAPERVLELLREVCEVDTVGMSFGVIKVKHLELDISLPRKENKIGKGHRGFLVEVDPELSVADAAARRDFTVNAIMYDPLTEELLDPHGGVEDLEKGILRHVSCHFSEDPLRVLRGMQFASRLEFTFAPETVALCRQISQEELAQERIGTEWEKLFLQSKKPSAGLKFLKDCSWIKFYPELEALPQEKWQKTLCLMDSCAASRSGERRSDLLFMCGAAVNALTPAGAECFCRRLWNRNELIADIVELAAAFQEEIGASARSVPEIRRLALRLKGVKLLCALLECAGEKDKAYAIAGAAKECGVWENAPKALLTGRHCIEAGVSPGEKMGELLKKCFEAQLDGIFDTVDEGKLYLQKLLKS